MSNQTTSGSKQSGQTHLRAKGTLNNLTFNSVRNFLQPNQHVNVGGGTNGEAEFIYERSP